jgi:hypothetical protein
MHYENIDCSSFWEFQQAIQTTNVLLKGTPHHLDDKKLCERIEAWMDQVLYVQATNAKYNEIVELHDWLSEVKSLDDKKRFERLQAIEAFEQSAAASRAVSRANTTNQSQNGVLTGPSRKANSGPTASAPADSAAAKSDYPPKLTEEEKALLLKYDGCLKCRKPFVAHKGSDKAPGCVFPVRTSYRLHTCHVRYHYGCYARQLQSKGGLRCPAHREQ